jgi:MFS family permease
MSTTAVPQQPTGVRYGVLGFVCSLSMITYLDRVCFGSAMPYIVKDLGLTSVADLKWAVTAFAFAYATFEIPTGWLGDVHGPRNTLIRIVLWWSLFTAFTGTVGMEVNGYVLGGIGALAVVRFLFGMGEAGAYPNITRALHNWFPFFQRGLAQGAVWMSGRLMGGLTPILWVLLVERLSLSWRDAFWVFGGLGILWCLAFASWFRNRPEEKPSVNAAELAVIRAGRSDVEAGHAHVPWLKLLRDVNLWTLCLMYFFTAYGWYFNITYLHTFLDEQYGVKPDSLVGGVYKGGPLWLGAVSCLIGGYLTDWIIRKTGSQKWGRRVCGLTGHSLCALFYFLLILAPNAFTFFLFISLAAFWNDITMGSSWAVCQDIGKRYAAIVAGWMNTIGNLGGAAAGWVTGEILQYYLDEKAELLGKAAKELSKPEKAAALLPGYQVNFVIFGLVYVLAAVLWLRIDSTRPVAQE